MEQPARDDVQFQILEHLRALRAELRAVNARLDRIETALGSRQDSTARDHA